MSDSYNEAAVAFDNDMSGSAVAPKAPAAPQQVERMDMGDFEGGEEGDDVNDEERNDGVVDEEFPEGDGEDVEGEPEEGEGEDGDEGDEGQEDGEKYKVTVDGQETEVTLREALDGYIRQETFHQRLNKVNEAQNIVMRAAGEVAQKRDATISLYEEMEANLSGLLPKEPDWDAEFAKDPAKARKLQTDFESFKKQLGDIKTKREALTAEKQQEETRQLQAWADQENAKIPRLFPEWADDKIRERDMTSMRRTAASAGFSNDEIDGIIDTRYLVLLSKAAKLDRMQARRAQPNPNKKGAAQVKANPGAGSTRTAPKGRAKAQQHLSRTGSVDAAGDVFASILART